MRNKEERGNEGGKEKENTAVKTVLSHLEGVKTSQTGLFFCILRLLLLTLQFFGPCTGTLQLNPAATNEALQRLSATPV